MDSTALAFVTFFLSLTQGPQSVELRVMPPISEVVVQLDGREVGRLPAPPWQLTVDLGRGIVPHRLQAVGLDAGGAVVARVSQRINMPSPEAEVGVVLRRDGEGRVTGASMSWQMSRWRAADSLHAELDGKPVPVDPGGEMAWAALPAGDVHTLRVVAEFGSGVAAAKELAFGADLEEQAGTVLTGVVVRRKGRARLAAAELSGALLAGGRSARVVEVEGGPARVVLVGDPAATSAFWSTLARAHRRRAVQGSGVLPGADTVIVVRPEPESKGLPGGRVGEIFPLSVFDRLRADELLRALLRWGFPVASAERSRLADAVAVAGLVAATRSQRRAVVAVLGEAGRAADAPAIRDARTYLGTIGVPLFAWSPFRQVARSRESPWGPILDVSLPGGLADADNRLQKELALQQVAWIEGDWLPTEVALAPDAAGVVLAGRLE